MYSQKMQGLSIEDSQCESVAKSSRKNLFIAFGFRAKKLTTQVNPPHVFDFFMVLRHGRRSIT